MFDIHKCQSKSICTHLKRNHYKKNLSGYVFFIGKMILLYATPKQHPAHLQPMSIKGWKALFLVHRGGRYIGSKEDENQFIQQKLQNVFFQNLSTTLPEHSRFQIYSCIVWRQNQHYALRKILHYLYNLWKKLLEFR